MGSDVEKLWKGDGKAWRREQKDIIAWAKKLGYSNIISETDDKDAWEAWKSGFLSWKDGKSGDSGSSSVPGAKSYEEWSARAKELGWSPDQYSMAAYQGYLNNLVGSGGGGGGSIGPTNSYGDPIGPYPYPNVFFPQLTQAYERPAAQDWGPPLSGPLGDPLLYQPWTSDYRSKYGGIMEYQPPRLNVGPPRFSPNVTGFLDFGEPGIPEGWLEYLGPPTEEKNEEEPEGDGGRGGEGENG